MLGRFIGFFFAALLAPCDSFAPAAAVRTSLNHGQSRRRGRTVRPGGSGDENENQTETVLAPQSPCNSICRYKRDFFEGQVCIGCHRDIFEIKVTLPSPLL